VFASLIAGGGVAAITHQIPTLILAPGILGTLDRIITNSFLFAALYLGAVILLQGGPQQLLGFAKLVFDLLPAAKTPEVVASTETGQAGFAEDVRTKVAVHENAEQS
jgi:hypothetical protein